MQQFRLGSISALPISKDAYLYSIASTAARQNLAFDSTAELKSTDRLAVISSDNTLSILDPETLQVVPNGHVQSISQSVTCLQPYAAAGSAADVVFTAGRDGQVKGWDIRTSQNVLTLQTPNVDALSALDTNFSTTSIAAGTELEGNGPGNVNIYLWDVRSPEQPQTTYSESHTDTITELRYLPYSSSSSSTTLLSGSTDGLVTVFNTSVADEDDAVLQVSNHYSAIHHAGLIGDNKTDGNAACDIYALGTDEKLAFYVQQSEDPEQQDPDPFVVGDLRDKIQCDYALRIFNGQQPMLVVGNHNGDVQDLRLLPLIRAASGRSASPQWTIDESATVILPEAHGTEVVRDFYYCNVGDTQSVAFTCGEDGTVKQWVM